MGRSTLTECGHRDLHFAIRRYRLEHICSLGEDTARTGENECSRKKKLKVKLCLKQPSVLPFLRTTGQEEGLPRLSCHYKVVDQNPNAWSPGLRLLNSRHSRRSLSIGQRYSFLNDVIVAEER